MSRAPDVVNLFFNILTWLILARVILSWIPTRGKNPLVRMVYEFTEPLLAPFRKIMPRTGMPIDLSPFLAYLVLQLLRTVIIQML